MIKSQKIKSDSRESKLILLQIDKTRSTWWVIIFNLEEKLYLRVTLRSDAQYNDVKPSRILHLRNHQLSDDLMIMSHSSCEQL